MSIAQLIDGSAKIPFPVGDEIMTVQQVLGTFIACPRDLIAVGNNDIVKVLSSPKVRRVFLILFSILSKSSMCLLNIYIYIYIYIYLIWLFSCPLFSRAKKVQGKKSPHGYVFQCLFQYYVWSVICFIYELLTTFIYVMIIGYLLKLIFLWINAAFQRFCIWSFSYWRPFYVISL